MKAKLCISIVILLIGRIFVNAESAPTVLVDADHRQNVSVNGSLNQILLTCTGYDRPMKRFDMMKLPRSAFKRLLEAGTDEAKIEAGRVTGRDVPGTYIRAKWGGAHLRERA